MVVPAKFDFGTFSGIVNASDCFLSFSDSERVAQKEKSSFKVAETISRNFKVNHQVVIRTPTESFHDQR